MIKFLNRFIIFLFIAIDIWYVYDKLSNGITDRLMISLLVIPVLLVPWLVKKLFKYEMNEIFILVYYIFTFCCIILGSILNFYNIPSTRRLDKITHFISGILTSIIALLAIKKFSVKSPKRWFVVFFIITFNLAVAGLWEIFEFTGDSLLGTNMQHLETGVRDTMQDIISATLGSLLFALYYCYQTTKAKDNKIKKLEKLL